MDGFNWDVTNVIDELVPLPPCLRSNYLKELDSSSEQYPNVDQAFGFDESSLSHAISDFHKLESSNGNTHTHSNLRNGMDIEELFHSKHLPKHHEPKQIIIRNEVLSPPQSISSSDQSFQSTTINSSLGLMQTPIHVDCTRNPNIRKRRMDNSESCPSQTFVAPNFSQGQKRFEIVFDSSTSRPKRPKPCSSIKSASISFGPKSSSGWELDEEAMAEVKEMVYIQAALQPVNLELEESAEKPKRKNVKVSSDPQTVAARHRREKISERLRILQRLVPGGAKLDTASMLDEAANYVKFLQVLVRSLENLDPTVGTMIRAINMQSKRDKILEEGEGEGEGETHKFIITE